MINIPIRYMSWNFTKTCRNWQHLTNTEENAFFRLFQPLVLMNTHTHTHTCFLSFLISCKKCQVLAETGRKIETFNLYSTKALVFSSCGCSTRLTGNVEQVKLQQVYVNGRSKEGRGVSDISKITSNCLTKHLLL